MQNNLHEKPDHDPSSASPASQTVSASPTQLLENIKDHLCHIKSECQGEKREESRLPGWLVVCFIQAEGTGGVWDGGREGCGQRESV
ncbi:hypothetical protein AMECASPLE_019492 [Ameca splendens]|uniref:Uncharacterized protein n=1 Tax=Ameca splendens TaxID=208324 RepID=A0ABV0XG63_9TELE